jgi:hypothetical protein
MRPDGAGTTGVILRRITMPSIRISENATEKILKDRETHSTLSGKSLIPRLTYYCRSYSTLNDGRIIEHGPGFILSFIEQSEAAQYHDLTVGVGSGCTLLLAPSTFFQAGAHFIDWADQKFKLDSVLS